jgi:hypothetical protein
MLTSFSTDGESLFVSKGNPVSAKQGQTLETDCEEGTAEVPELPRVAAYGPRSGNGES